MKNCPFCDILQKSDVIAKSEYFLAKPDRYPVTPGHTLIIPRRHITKLDDLTMAEWTNMLPFIRYTQKCLAMTNLEDIYLSYIQDPLDNQSKTFCIRAISKLSQDKSPIGHNYGINDGKAAGQTIEHFHMHLIPRYDGDVPDPRGGVRHVIPEHGNYHF